MLNSINHNKYLMQSGEMLLLRVAWLLLCWAPASMLVTTVTTTTTTTDDTDTYSILKGGFIAKPGCPTKCGNLTVPYPFGIKEGCAMEPWFEITCDSAVNPHNAFIQNDRQVYDISDARLRISNVVANTCDHSPGRIVAGFWWMELANFINTPYSFSDENKGTLIGCNGMSLMALSQQKGGLRYIGCISNCSNVRDVHANNGSCSGDGCCQISIPKGQKYAGTFFLVYNKNISVDSFNPCSYIFLGEQKSFKFRGAEDLSDTKLVDRINTSVPILLDWTIGNFTSCEEAQKSDSYACKANSDCISDVNLEGYRCRCKDGYDGNPYLDQGCQGIGEAFPETKIFIVIGFGVLSLLVGISWLYIGIQKRKLIKMREKYFQQNGGTLLKQKINSNENGLESTKIFTAKELEKATNNYAEDRIIGQGGYGIVYKGILPDKRTVAIKKSKVTDKNQIEQFINEVIILTQVNHRNVVKLLGCCLEAAEVPLLVYEYISNGTLFYHIQNGGTSWLSWDNRLRIAAETASALAYLHLAASTPIIHRDVKSSNILLDDYYTAKISDFGASRLVPLDQTQVTTLVQGTLGYLDPEYFHTSQLTEKSDVYSFGVVLAELLTGKKPICMERSQEERNLANYLITSMNENCLFQILDPLIVREGSLEQFQQVAHLIKRCLHLNGENRPTMKEVTMELESLRKNNKHPWVQTQDVNEEGVGLMAENEATTDLYGGTEERDLYTIQLNSYVNAFNVSREYSSELDTAPMMFSANIAH